MARRAAELGFDTVWVGERGAPDSPARLSALAATTVGICLGLGAVPLTARGADQMEETVTTLSLIASGRVGVVVDLPTTLSGPVRPGWQDRLASISSVVRRAGIPFGAVVQDVVTASTAAPHVDRLVLRSPDTHLVSAVAGTAASSGSATDVEVWLDLATGAAVDALLPAVVAERLAVPGVPGHRACVDVTRRVGLTGLRGDVESAYAAGRPTEAASMIPASLVEATCLTDRVTTPAARLEEYRNAGAGRVSVIPHWSDADERRAALEVLSTPH